MGVHRLFYGVLTLMTLLLYRNTFVDASGLFRGGLAGLGEVLAAGAAGTLLAAAVTPWAGRRWGRARGISGVVGVGGGGQLALRGVVVAGGLVGGALTLGFVSHGD